MAGASYTIPSTKLDIGTRVVARYKGERYTVEAIPAEEGSTDAAYRVENDGTVHKSLSAASKHVCEGKTPAVLRFWNLEGSEGANKEPRQARAAGDKATKTGEKKARVSKPRSARATKNIKKMRKQAKTEEGLVGYFCSACQDGFYLSVEEGEPTTCPQGHPANMADELAPEGEIAETETVETAQAEEEVEDITA